MISLCTIAGNTQNSTANPTNASSNDKSSTGSSPAASANPGSLTDSPSIPGSNQINQQPDAPPDPRIPGAGPVTGPPQKLLPPDTIPLGVDQFANPPQTQVNLKGPSGKFVQFVGDLTFRKPCIDCTGVRVKIQNDSSSPIIIDGNRAQALRGQKTLDAMSEDLAMTESGGSFTTKQKVILGTTALTTLGLAEPILQDHFSTSKTDFPISYGTNETRRRLEDLRLARRIILPGEDTDGVIFFPGDSFSFEKITIPVQTYPQGMPVGTIDITPDPAQAEFNKAIHKKNRAASDKAEQQAVKREAKRGGYADPSDNSIKDLNDSIPKDMRTDQQNLPTKPAKQKQPKEPKAPKTKKER